jgi:hypothetical protein
MTPLLSPSCGERAQPVEVQPAWPNQLMPTLLEVDC